MRVFQYTAAPVLYQDYIISGASQIQKSVLKLLLKKAYIEGRIANSVCSQHITVLWKKTVFWAVYIVLVKWFQQFQIFFFTLLVMQTALHFFH